MNRYPIVLMLVSLYVHNAFPLISKNAQEGVKLKEEINTKKNTTVINKDDVMRKYENDFDWIVGYWLSTQEKNRARVLKCKCSHEFEANLDNKFYNSQYEAEKGMPGQRAACVANLAKIMAACHYEEYIAKKNQKYDAKTQQTIEDEAHKKALKAVQLGYNGNIKYLVNGDFEKELEKNIDALLPKEIYELYPEGPNRQETITNISNGKHHRLDDCCVCGDPFKEIGKRVNLPCGHDICPSCLYKNKYEWSRHTCPQCRRDITNADFPADYLKKHKN